MQTIIVTGGAGYIGSHTIIELLLHTPYRIVSVDNFSRSSEWTYDRIRQVTGKAFDTIDIDLCDAAAVKNKLGSLRDVLGIIHFAAFKSVPESMADPILYYRNNIDSLLNLLDLCGASRIPNFIFSSSCSVYGNAKDLPVTEQTSWQKAESPYGHTKQMGEDIVNFFSRANPSFRGVILRYFNPVGAHMSGLNGEVPLGRPDNLVPIITQTAVGKNSLTIFGNDYDTRDGYCIRDYIHVTDIATAHLRAMDYIAQGRNREPVSLFNLGTGRGVSVMEVIHAFEKVSGRKLEYKIGQRRPGDVVAVYANNDKAKSELGWDPQFNLDDMMSSAWKWQLKLEEEAVPGETKKARS